MRKQLRKSADSDAILTTFSTRLTPVQQDLVVRAAELRGWSVANLIRIAALEKAAHIVNTSQPTRLNFRSLASRVARQLTAPIAEVVINDGENVVPSLDYFLEHLELIDHAARHKAEISHLTAPEISELEQAIKYGGSEFFRLVLDRCHPSEAPDAELPEPIDPSSFSTVSEE